MITPDSLPTAEASSYWTASAAHLAGHVAAWMRRMHAIYGTFGTIALGIACAANVYSLTILALYLAGVITS